MTSVLLTLALCIEPVEARHYGKRTNPANAWPRVSTTEYLTPNGWLPGYEYRGRQFRDRWQLNPDTGRYFYTPLGDGVRGRGEWL
jgi:hypothetical protein